MQAAMISVCKVKGHLKWAMKIVPLPIGLTQRSQLIRPSWPHGRGGEGGFHMYSWILRRSWRNSKEEESFRSKSVIRSIINLERHKNLKEQELIRVFPVSAQRLSPFPQPQGFQRPDKPLRHLNITLTHPQLPPGSYSTSLTVGSAA